MAMHVLASDPTRGMNIMGAKRTITATRA